MQKRDCLFVFLYIKKAQIRTPAIEQVSRFFVFVLGIRSGCIAIFLKTNAKAILTTCGHQKRILLGEAGSDPRLVSL